MAKARGACVFGGRCRDLGHFKRTDSTYFGRPFILQAIFPHLLQHIAVFNLLVWIPDISFVAGTPQVLVFDDLDSRQQAKYFSFTSSQSQSDQSQGDTPAPSSQWESIDDMDSLASRESGSSSIVAAESATLSPRYISRIFPLVFKKI